ncbi:MAG: CPBP family glutamic-type intramembrane protease [Acidimicrobiales bacterium]
MVVPGAAAGAVRFPGWYAEPNGRARYRWWDGWSWSAWVSDGLVVGVDPLPVWVAPSRPERRSPETRLALPGRAGLVALVGIVAGVALAVLGMMAGRLLFGASRAPALALSALGLWSGLIGACIVVSRRHGTGSVRCDFGAAGPWTDLGRGLVVSVIGRVAVTLVVIPLVMANRRLLDHGGGGTLRSGHLDEAALATFAVIAIVGAPIVEELFFRGLLFRSFQGRLGVGGAALAQGALFGLAHASPLYGLRNVFVIAATATFGIVLAIVAERYRRLTPGMAAHAFFNLVAVAALAAAGS